MAVLDRLARWHWAAVVVAVELLRAPVAQAVSVGSTCLMAPALVDRLVAAVDQAVTALAAQRLRRLVVAADGARQAVPARKAFPAAQQVRQQAARVEARLARAPMAFSRLRERRQQTQAAQAVKRFP